MSNINHVGLTAGSRISFSTILIIPLTLCLLSDLYTHYITSTARLVSMGGSPTLNRHCWYRYWSCSCSCWDDRHQMHS